MPEEPTAPVGGDTPGASHGTTIDAIDWPGLESRYARRPQFVERLAAVAATSMGDVPLQLRGLAEAGRTAEIARAAHSLRTGADVIMAYATRDLAAQVEAACLAGATDAIVQALSLADAVDELLASLQRRINRPAR